MSAKNQLKIASRLARELYELLLAMDDDGHEISDIVDAAENTDYALNGRLVALNRTEDRERARRLVA
jgi:hypothetical protein